MSVTAELNAAREKLFEKLGDNTKLYCQLMKQWFSMKMTKEEFDSEARKLMTTENLRFHNQFLLCLFNKCTFLTSDNIRSRYNNKKARLAKQKRSGDKGAFQPVDPVNYLPQLEPPPQHLQEEAQRYCAQELFLPDHALVMGRLMVGAWELGMEGADDSAAEFLVVAVQCFLKNILTAIFSQRSGYRLHKKKAIVSVGCPVPNPWLRNVQESFDERLDIDDDSPRLQPTAAELEQREVYQMACATTRVEPPAKQPVSAYDVVQALMVHKSAIPAHSLYAINMERIICSLNHPSWEELEAGKMFKT